MSNPGWDLELQTVPGLSSHNRPVYPEYAPNPQPDWIEPKYFASRRLSSCQSGVLCPLKDPCNSPPPQAMWGQPSSAVQAARCIGPQPDGDFDISHSDLLDRVPRQRVMGI
jgi:hypothetical protein